MENLIAYYYNIDNITIHKKMNYFILFTSNVNKYILIELSRDVSELEQIDLLLKNKKKYSKIVKNKFNNYHTLINGKYYILFLYVESELLDDVLFSKDYIDVPIIHVQKLMRYNWVDLWSKKIDYFEYQLDHVAGEHPIIRDSINYYIGLAETAISYVKNTLIKYNDRNLVIAHRRFYNDKILFNNPLNIVVDYKSRDVSEYLKYIFIENKYSEEIISNIINKINFDINEYQLLMGRLMFPSFYFDVYENIINRGIGENEIIKIVKRNLEYEDYLKLIYKQVNKRVKIAKIDFL